MAQFSQVLVVLWLVLQILPYYALPQTQLEYDEEIVENFIEDLNSLDPDQNVRNISHIGDVEQLESNSKEKYSNENNSSVNDQNDNKLPKVLLNETYINHLGSGEMNSSDEEQLESTEMDSDELNSKENYYNENYPHGNITIKFNKPMENISSIIDINENQLIKVISNETYINDLGSDKWNSSDVDHLDSNEMDTEEKYSNEKQLNGSNTNHLGSDERNSMVSEDIISKIIDSTTLYHGDSSPEKAIDNDLKTFWNPISGGLNSNNWYIIFELSERYTVTSAKLRNFNDITHDVSEFKLEVSDNKDDWFLCGIARGVLSGSREWQSFDGFSATGKFLKFTVTKTHSGWQPWLREIDFIGYSGVCTTVEGEQCIFPFEYSGRVYSTCIRTNISEASWCIMDHRANWGYCSDTCKQEDFSSEVVNVIDHTDVGAHKVLLVLGDEVSELKHQVLLLSEKMERGEQKLTTLQEEVAHLTNLLQQNIKEINIHD